MTAPDPLSFAFSVGVLEESQRRERFPYEIELLGQTFAVFEGVFSPKYLPAADWFASHLPFRAVSPLSLFCSLTHSLPLLMALVPPKLPGRRIHTTPMLHV